MATGLATINDVKRKLHISATDTNAERDAWLQSELDSAASWFTRIARQDWSAAVGGTWTVYDVHEDGQIDLPQEGCTVVSVTVVLDVDNLIAPVYTQVLTTDDYDVVDNRYIRFRPITVWQVFENAWATRPFKNYRFVQVVWTQSAAGVPAAVTDGIAMLAAGQYMASPRLASGLMSEKIGDYSYSTKQNAGGQIQPGAPMGEPDGFVTEGMRLLRPFMRRRIAVV